MGLVFSPLDKVSNEASSFCLFIGQHSTIGFVIHLRNFFDPHIKHRIGIYLCWKSGKWRKTCLTTNENPNQFCVRVLSVCWMLSKTTKLILLDSLLQEVCIRTCLTPVKQISPFFRTKESPLSDFGYLTKLWLWCVKFGWWKCVVLFGLVIVEKEPS